MSKKTKAKAKRKMPPSWYSTKELLREADWLWWCGEGQMAWDIMQIIAIRVTKEHPPNGEMERQIEEGSEPAASLGPVRGDFID